jgi:glycosyltransferase involved in cell wall biosynthesis
MVCQSPTGSRRKNPDREFRKAEESGYIYSNTLPPRTITMKVLHVCFADSNEGGAIGAYRLHTSMRAQDIDSRLLVIRKRRNDPTVFTPPAATRILVRWWNIVSRRILSLQRTRHTGYRSLNLFPTGLHRTINRCRPDVVQCHWINRNTISIRELTKIHAPVVLKLPDMWAFSGAEHYLAPDARKRYQEGYTRKNRQPGDSGLDLDRMVWNCKRRSWKHADFAIVTPSKWLAGCARESVLFGRYRVENIANPIDLDTYRPVRNRRDARIAQGLPPDKHLVLFGSVHAETDPRKGFHHLQRALAILREQHGGSGDIELVMFGTKERKTATLAGFVAHHLGTVRDDRALAEMYGAADVMVLPTESDNLPNTIQEATACGTPCVGFDVGGMPDMIRHRDTGYLAQAFDAADLARGIQWAIGNGGDQLSAKVRRYAEEIFDPAERVADYMRLYENVVRSHANRS